MGSAFRVEVPWSDSTPLGINTAVTSALWVSIHIELELNSVIARGPETVDFSSCAVRFIVVNVKQC